MNRIVIIAIILFICSCGTTKKISHNESHSKVNIETSFLDTSKRVASWEMIVNSVIKRIDLSKIRITTFYPEKDSSGEQLVKEVILIDNNITVTESKSEEESKTENENNGVALKNTMSGENDISISNSIEKKLSVKNKVLLGAVIIIIVALTWLALKLRKWIFWVK